MMGAGWRKSATRSKPLKTHYVQYYLDNLAAGEAERDALLQRTGIDYRKLNDAAYSIEIDQIIRFLRNIVATNDDPLLAIRLGQTFSVKHLGLMGHGIMSCENIVKAAEYWNHFNQLVGNVLSYQPELRSDNLYELKFVTLGPLGKILPFCIEQSLASTLAVLKELTGAPSHYERIDVSYMAEDACAPLESYQDHFRCPINFGAKENRALLRQEDFNRPIIMADDETLRILERHCQEVLRSMLANTGVGQQIRQIFLKHSRTPPKISKVAEMLGISERSLRRRLDEEGLSYSQLLNEFRRDLSGEYLKTTKLSAKEIAYLVGYDNVSSFRRAFKDWTGKTVNEFRGLTA